MEIGVRKEYVITTKGTTTLQPLSGAGWKEEVQKTEKCLNGAARVYIRPT
jgi:hypothetical protein